MKRNLKLHRQQFQISTIKIKKKKKQVTAKRQKLTLSTFRSMSNQSGLTVKIKSLQNSDSNDNTSSKLQMLRLFMSNCQKKYPDLTAQIEGKNMIASVLKNFFSNSKELMFYKNQQAPENYLAQKEFQQRIEFIFSHFIKTHDQYVPKIQLIKKSQPEDLDQDLTQNLQQQDIKLQNLQNQNTVYPKIDFVNFLQFWLENEETVQIFYENYFDAVKNSVKSFETNLYNAVSKNVLEIPSIKQIKEEKKEESPQFQAILKQSKVVQKKVKKPDFEKKNQQMQVKKEEDPQRNSINSIKNSKKFQELSDQRTQNSRVRASQKIEKSESEEQRNQLQQDQTTQNHRVSSFSTHSQTPPQSNFLSEPRDNFKFYLKKFYDHYCKKYLNTIKNQEFQKLGDFYNSMNLTKFMQYAKDVRLLKIDKAITAKHLQQLFKAEENQKHCLEYDGFAKIVRSCLQVAFQTKNEVETNGYEHIGVFNRQNFAQVMVRLGVIVPLKKIIFSKVQDMRSIERMVKSRTKEEMGNMRHSKVLKQSHFQGDQQTGYGHGYESNWDSNKLHPELFLNQKERKQQKLLQSLTIPKLNKLQPSKHMDQKLHEMVDDDYDPYLKRFNQRNKSTHENGSGHGMMKRIDERIQNVVKKIR